MSTPARRTPGPVREWVFRDDEVSTDTRSSTTELQESSQEEEVEVGRLLPLSAKAKQALPKGLDIARAAPNSDKGALYSRLCIARHVCEDMIRLEMHAACWQDRGRRAREPRAARSERGCEALRCEALQLPLQ